jgi:very-short-patch-repair endonuclease
MPVESAKTVAYRRLARTRGWDAAIAALAERQHGVVSRGQLLGLGLKASAIDRRCRAGRLHPLYPGVFRVGHRLIQREGRWIGAILVSGPEALLSHWSAAALWGISPSSRELIDITVSHPTRSSKQIRRHLSAVPGDERTIEEGIPVTSAPRTILDLAATEAVDTVENLLREMEYRELRDRLSLWDLIERYPGKRGVRKVRLALQRLREEPGGRRRSGLEERFAPFLRHHRLPQPRFNAWIVLGPKRFQVDCHWPDTGQIVELDGWQGHGTRSAFREDRARDRALRVAGYQVIRLTWNQLDDEPAAVAADLRALLRRERQK